jgi:hypothetical protein
VGSVDGRARGAVGVSAGFTSARIARGFREAPLLLVLHEGLEQELHQARKVALGKRWIANARARSISSRSSVSAVKCTPKRSADRASGKRRHTRAAATRPPALRASRAYAPRRSRPSCIQSPFSAVVSPRGHCPGLRWPSLHPRGLASRRQLERDAKLGREIVTNHQSRQERQVVESGKVLEAPCWSFSLLGGWALSQAHSDAEGWAVL